MSEYDTLKAGDEVVIFGGMRRILSKIVRRTKTRIFTDCGITFDGNGWRYPRQRYSPCSLRPATDRDRQEIQIQDIWGEIRAAAANLQAVHEPPSPQVLTALNELIRHYTQLKEDAEKAA